MKTDLGMNDHGEDPNHWFVKIQLGIDQLRLLHRAVCLYSEVWEEIHKRAGHNTDSPRLVLEAQYLENLKTFLYATLLEHTYHTGEPPGEDSS
tara:strand:+ start:161 stop:439 length:279 start_codon:yes stop_codon:yes gene_type:complete